MFFNYLKTAFRNIIRNKFFSAINIFGLAVAMSICMGIFMLVADQMMYDRHNTRRDRVYRVNTIPQNRDGLDQSDNEYATTALPLRNELMEIGAGIEKSGRIVRGFGNSWIEFEQDVNIPLHGFFVDPEILEIFEYELEHGDPKTALVEPFSVVLTKRAAEKLFEQENPVGEIIKVGKQGDFKVTGVIKESNHKSHMVFEALASVSTVRSLEAAQTRGKDRERDLENWTNYTAGWVYVLLEQGKTPGDLQPTLDRIFLKHYAPITNPDVNKVKFRLQPLMNITPGPLVNNAIGPFIPWLFVYFFAGLGAVILITSCFNFTNLSIARSLSRAKEIGVRKVTGAMRYQIFTQFIAESVVMALLALVAALVMLVVVKPFMLNLTIARVMKWDLEANYWVYLVFLSFSVLVGGLAGLFPAVVLSGFQPTKVLKGFKSIKLIARIGMRKVLLVGQFTLSLIFILTVITVYNQLNLFLNADYGFDMKNKILVRLNNTSAANLKTELLKQSPVESVSASSHVPAAGTSYGFGFKKSLDEKEWTGLGGFYVDEDYLKNMEIPLLQGRFFNTEAGESNNNFIVINEKAVHAFHFTSASHALGQVIIFQNDSTKKEIIGVVRDYNHGQLMQGIEPMALMFQTDKYNLIQVKYSGTFDEASAIVTSSWEKVNPGLKIDFKDMEQEIKMFYDIIFGDLVKVLSVISFFAITISCLGLLGMATYATETRMKEISIRKVLGSSNPALIYLLSKDYITILALAIIVAVPSAYFLNNLWLEFIAYHITISTGMLAFGVLILILFGVFTVGSQTWRATYVNPVDNLKSE